MDLVELFRRTRFYLMVAAILLAILKLQALAQLFSGQYPERLPPLLPQKAACVQDSLDAAYDDATTTCTPQADN